MEEFRISNGKQSGTMRKNVETSPVAEQFYSTMSELPDVAQNQTSISDEVSNCSDDDLDTSDTSDISRTEALQIASISGNTRNVFFLYKKLEYLLFSHQFR